MSHLLFLQIHLDALSPFPKINHLSGDILRAQNLVPRIHYALHVNQAAVHARVSKCAVQGNDLRPLCGFYEREREQLRHGVPGEMGVCNEQRRLEGRVLGGGLQAGDVVLGDEVEGEDLDLGFVLSLVFSILVMS